jgi:hypothetical protein
MRPPLAQRLYRAALFAYPPAFRLRFGEEMLEFFRARDLAARAAGRLARLRFWAT